MDYYEYKGIICNEKLILLLTYLKYVRFYYYIHTTTILFYYVKLNIH